jgi:hypothetical protein
VIFFVAGIAAIMASIHKPVWYEPVSIPRTHIRSVRNSAINQFNEFSRLLVAGEPFNFSLDAPMVTAWMTERDAIWPGAGHWIPPSMKDPVVAFEGGKIILAARAERSGWQAILSAEFTVNIQEHELVVRLDSVACGDLSLPARWTSRAVDRLASLSDQDVDTLPAVLAEAVEKLREQNAAEYLREGAIVENEFEWKNGGRWFRIAAVHAENGALTLQVVPL